MKANKKKDQNQILPTADSDDFLESTKYLGCFDSITEGDGPVKGNTVLDIGFSNVNPVIHVPGTILGASVMENFGRIYGGHDRFQYSIYSHAFCPSLSEVQVAFYEEETALAEKIGVDLARYPKEDFFSRASILGPEYMGEGCIVPFDEQWETGFTTGPFSIQNRYVTEDVPVGCHVYHELGKKFGVPTPVIDSMITIASVMVGQDFYKTGVTLEDLGISDLSKDELLTYLNEGVYASTITWICFTPLFFTAGRSLFSTWTGQRKKEMVLRQGGAFYVVSPLHLVWDDENYYLIAYDENAGKVKHYRVDKILSLTEF